MKVFEEKEEFIPQKLGCHLNVDKELKNPFTLFGDVSFHLGTFFFQALKWRRGYNVTTVSVL